MNEPPAGRLPLDGRSRRGDDHRGPDPVDPCHVLAETRRPWSHRGKIRQIPRLTGRDLPPRGNRARSGVATPRRGGPRTGPRTDGQAHLPLRDGPRSDLAMATRPIEALEPRGHRATTDGSTVPTPCTQGGLRGPRDDPGRRRCAAHPDLRLDPLQRRAQVRAADARAPARPTPIGGRRPPPIGGRRPTPIGGRRDRPVEGRRAGRHRARPPERRSEHCSTHVPAKAHPRGCAGRHGESISEDVACATLAARLGRQRPSGRPTA